MDRTRFRLIALIVVVALAAGCAAATPQAAPTATAAAIATGSPIASPSLTPPSVHATATPEPSSSAPSLSADPRAPASNVTVKLNVATRRFVETDLTAPADKTWKLD